MPDLREGKFIRVKADHKNWCRCGKDGLIYEILSLTEVALTFGWDRHNNWQNVVCVGPELWAVDELDLDSI